MKFIRHLILVLLVLSWSVMVIGQTKSPSSTFFFIQITDPQFGFLDANKSFDKEKVLYNKAVDEMNRLNPAFVVITGDFVHNMGDSLQWDEFNRITSKINVPVFLCPGNHDIGENPTQQSIDEYRKKYGDDKFSFRYKKNRFIGLNSTVIKAGVPEFEQEQFLWLQKELLKSGRAKNILIFTHHPFFINDPDEPETGSNIGIEKRKKYLELFVKHKVNTVFAGHLHKNAYGRYKDLDMITTSSAGKQLGVSAQQNLPGFRIILVRNDHVSSKYYGLEEMPELIDFDSIFGHK